MTQALPDPDPAAIADLASAPGVADQALPPWPRDGDYARWFAQLAASPAPGRALRRLLPLLQAELSGMERLALWQALWSLYRRAGPTARAALAGALDGRFRDALGWLALPWGSDAMALGLARQGAPREDRAGWVPVWLAHLGLPVLEQPAAHEPWLVLLAAQAALEGATARLPPARIESLQAAVLDAAGRAPERLAMGLSLLFEIALQARDDETAGAVLAELLHAGQAGALRAERVVAWLDGRATGADTEAPRPLLLASPWQEGWLQPAAWADATARQALLAALSRPLPRARLALLDAHLQQLACGTPPAAGPSASLDPLALRRLQALDAVWARDESAQPLSLAQLPGLDRQQLAPATLAALFEAQAREAERLGDLEGRALACLLVRRWRGGAPAREALGHALRALDATPLPELGGQPADELPGWQRLSTSVWPAVRRIAQQAMARLNTEGLLEPRPWVRRPDLQAARRHWQAVQSHGRRTGAPAWEQVDASTALQGRALRLWAPLHSRLAGRDHLWIETPGAQRLLVVPSCVASHHGYADVEALQGELPDHHLLFIHNPERNWYCDSAFDEVLQLVRSRMAGRFRGDQVSCWYGSMGGHAALKLALHLGARGMAFNPQVDLDLWAAFRREDRAHLLSSRRHRDLLALPADRWGASPLYLAVGAGTPDREALSRLIGRWQDLPELSVIVEKFNDPQHAGLMARITGGQVAPALARIDQRLGVLGAPQPLPGMQDLSGPDAEAFWRQLDAAAVAAVEVQVRGGRLHWQPSRHTGTRAAG